MALVAITSIKSFRFTKKVSRRNRSPIQSTQQALTRHPVLVKIALTDESIPHMLTPHEKEVP